MKNECLLVLPELIEPATELAAHCLESRAIRDAMYRRELTITHDERSRLYVICVENRRVKSRLHRTEEDALRYITACVAVTDQMDRDADLYGQGSDKSPS